MSESAITSETEDWMHTFQNCITPISATDCKRLVFRCNLHICRYEWAQARHILHHAINRVKSNKSISTNKLRRDDRFTSQFPRPPRTNTDTPYEKQTFSSRPCDITMCWALFWVHSTYEYTCSLKPLNLTSGPAFNFNPSWKPFGTRVQLKLEMSLLVTSTTFPPPAFRQENPPVLIFSCPGFCS